MTSGGVVRIAMVAGEASGDLLASHLIQALRAKLEAETERLENEATTRPYRKRSE